MEEIKEEPKKKTPVSKFETFFRISMLFLLLLLLAVQVVSVANTVYRDMLCDVQKEKYERTVESLASKYQTAVYDTPEVDNINKQLFMANEYQFINQQLLMELITACRMETK